MMKKFTLLFVVCIFAISSAYSQNIALGKTTASSSNDNHALAVDGDAGTRWESAFEDPQWISIDLGASYDIGQVTLSWEGAFATEYEIQLSDDNSTWSTVYTESASDGGIDEIAITGTGRYIRMYGTVRATVYGYSLWEFEVYEAAAEGKDATLSDLTVGGVSIEGFSGLKTDYYYDLVFGTTEIPVVDATTTDKDAGFEVTNAESLPGATTVEVTSADYSTTKTYTINFVESIPDTSAPVPTNKSIDVIAVYSDAYTSIYTELFPGWGQSTVASEVQLDDDNTLKYANLNYMGLIYTATDVTEMEYVHLDYFTADATALKFYLIGEGETAYDIALEDGITTGSWVSLDIPLSHYTVPNLTNLTQIKTDGDGTVYLDNIYFWKEPAPEASIATLDTITVDDLTLANFMATNYTYTYELVYGTTTVPSVDAVTTAKNATYEVTDATVIPGATTIKVTSEDKAETKTYTINFVASIPESPAATPSQNEENVISVYSDAYTNIHTNLFPGWGQQTIASQVKIGADSALKYVNLNYMGIEFMDTNVTEMNFVHLDYFTIDATALSFFLIGTGENAYDIAAEDGITTGSWVSLDIPLTHYTAPNLEAVYQFKTEGNGTVYLDNLYFWKAIPGANNDATLSDLSIDGATVDGFSSTTEDYTYTLPAGTTTVPTVGVTTTDENASFDISPATDLPGTTTVVVTAEDGGTKKTYTVLFDFASALTDENIEVGAYPNPTADYIKLSATAIIDQVSITDLTGKLLQQLTVNKDNTIIDLNGLQNGVYIIQMEINNTVKSLKVMKY